MSLKVSTYISLILTFLSATALIIYGFNITQYVHDTFGVTSEVSIHFGVICVASLLYLFFLGLTIIQQDRKVINKWIAFICIALFIFIGGIFVLSNLIGIIMYYGQRG